MFVSLCRGGFAKQQRKIGHYKRHNDLIPKGKLFPVFKAFTDRKQSYSRSLLNNCNLPLSKGVFLHGIALIKARSFSAVKAGKLFRIGIWVKFCSLRFNAQ